MTITAKFVSKCACCGGSIRVGEKIEWTKGSPAKHAKCPSSPVPAPAKAPRLPKLVGDETSLTVEYKGSKNNREPNHAIGTVRWIKDGGERVACVCVGYAPARWASSDALEDNGNYRHGGYGAYLGYEYYRYATPAEYEALQAREPRLDGVCADARAAVAISRALALCCETGAAH